MRLSKGTEAANVPKVVEKMCPAIKNILQLAVKNGARLSGVSRDFR